MPENSYITPRAIRRASTRYATNAPRLCWRSRSSRNRFLHWPPRGMVDNTSQTLHLSVGNSERLAPAKTHRLSNAEHFLISSPDSGSRAAGDRSKLYFIKSAFRFSTKSPARNLIRNTPLAAFTLFHCAR